MTEHFTGLDRKVPELDSGLRRSHPRGDVGLRLRRQWAATKPDHAP